MAVVLPAPTIHREQSNVVQKIGDAHNAWCTMHPESLKVEMTARKASMSKIARSTPFVVLGYLFLCGCGRSDGAHVSSSALQQACSAFADIYRLFACLRLKSPCFGVPHSE